MNLSVKTKALLAVTTGNTIFGLSFLASKVALDYASPTVLLAARFFISFILLNILVLAGIGKIRFRGKNLLPMVLLAVCQPVLYFIGENYGIQYTSSSFSGVMIALVPVVAFLLATVFLKESFQFSKLFWSLCSLGGIVVISVMEQNSGSVRTVGILLLVVAILSAAFFNIISKKYSDSFTAFERTYFMFAIGSAAFLVLGLAETKGRLFQEIARQMTVPGFLVPVLYLSVFSSVIAFFCLNFAVSHLSIQQTTSFTNLTTVVSIVAGVVVLKESFSPVHALGTVLILLGIYKVNTGTATVRDPASEPAG